ncbi:MAG: TorF family putative porin, partial [Hyphomicrobium sp.]
MTMIRKVQYLAVAAAAAVSGFAGAARADDAPAFSYSFNIGAVSDYMFRGFSQRDDKPAIQGGADIGYGIFYAGVWASNVDENFVATNTEIDLYAGIKPVLGPVTFDFGVIYYGYPSQASAIATNFISGAVVDVDYFELKAGASFSPFTNATLGTNFYYSPDYSYETGASYT